MTLLSDLFVLNYGHSLELNSLEKSDEPDAVNFVGRAAKHNGVTARVRPIEGINPAPGGVLTVALGGQGGAGVAFLQPFRFYCGRDVMILTPRCEMTDQEKLWWATCISANRFRFGFGRQANRSLPSLRIPSPEKMPIWVQLANVDQFEGAAGPKVASSIGAMDIGSWKSFRYDSLFEIKKGRRLTKSSIQAGETPFIGAIDGSNGLRQNVSAAPNHPENTITVNYNGSVAEAFYQPVPYWASDDVNVLYAKFEMNQYIALFICTLIRKEKFRYNYGRKWHLDRMKEAIIKLPTSKDGDPDWKFMEDYIKGLPFSGKI